MSSNEPAYAKAIYVTPEEVTRALSRLLRVPEATFCDSVLAGMQQAATATRHHPPNYAGFIRWGDTVKFLRDQLKLKGWKSKNVLNYPIVLNPERSLAISVLSADAYTGRENRTPTNRRPKGSVTQDLVQHNQVFVQPKFTFEDEADELSDVTTWLLLYYWDRREQEVRMEVSLPRGMDGEGYINSWYPRIILNPIPWTAPALPGDDEDTGPINIDVEPLI